MFNKTIVETVNKYNSENNKVIEEDDNYNEDDYIPFQCSEGENIVDLTGQFKEFVTEDDVTNYLISLINKPLDTASPPLKVKVNEDNIPHVVRTNITLKGSKKVEHLKAVKNNDTLLSEAFGVHILQNCENVNGKINSQYLQDTYKTL